MSDKEEELKNTQNTESDEEDDSEYEEEEENDENRVPIDLSENEIYRGVCTLLEDDDGNNMNHQHVCGRVQQGHEVLGHCGQHHVS
jgi:hypothetical protein